ncbi:hypothetical protein [Bacterioplanoides pacificum]|uniref:Uncharacterized protein n=1 Tax=Bacterioplanoides pacificum TaxID=1171596 RepID=A0ABV7VRC3_9GAMM
MMSKYSVAFLIPRDTVRSLCDDGWEFSSESRIPSEVESLLKSEFSETEVTPEYSSYESGNVMVGISKDSSGQIENVYFRFYEGLKPTLPLFLTEFSQLNNLDFFIPSN